VTARNIFVTIGRTAPGSSPGTQRPTDFQSTVVGRLSLSSRRKCQYWDLPLDIVLLVGYSSGQLRRGGPLESLSGRYRVLSKRAVLIAGVCSLFVPTAVFAHHGLRAQFDTEQTITLTGTVKKMDWSNPHVRLYIELKDSNNWELYMGSPYLQMMNGMKIDTYRRGDQVRIDAYPARDGSNVGYARKIRAISGRTFGR